MQLTTWLGFALLAAVFAALTNFFGKLGVSENITSNMATWVRIVVSLCVASAYVTYKAEWKNPVELPGKAILFLTLSGIATGLSWLCYFKAQQIGPASGVAAVDKLSVALLIILSVVFLKESFTLTQWAGAGLILCGIYLVAK
jgi:transporter family protein